MENERMERLEERKFFAQQMTMLQEEIQSLKSGNYSIKPKHVSEKVSYSAQSSHKDEVPRNDGNDQIIMLGEANTLAVIHLCFVAIFVSNSVASKVNLSTNHTYIYFFIYLGKIVRFGSR